MAHHYLPISFSCGQQDRMTYLLYDFFWFLFSVRVFICLKNKSTLIKNFPVIGKI